MAGHRPSIWVSDLYGAQQGHADLWQVCLAHQLRDCQYAIDAGDTIFAPRMKALLLRAVVLARRRKRLAESTRRSYLRRLDHDLNAIMGLAPGNPHGKRLRKRYGKVRNSLFTFLTHPDAPPDNNGSERELRPTATYRKVTGGFRSKWGADLFAGVRSVVGTAARRGLDAYQAIYEVLGGDLSFSRVEQLLPGDLTWIRFPVPSGASTENQPPLPATTPATPTPAKRRVRPPPTVPTVSVPVPPPANGYWWNAEQAVRQALENEGWTVLDVSRFGVGYDLRAFNQGTIRHVEVKSSVGLCTPVLTSNERNVSLHLRDTYVLAVVENFDPLKPVSIQWVQDPATLPTTARSTMVYSLPRSSWRPNASASIP